MIELKNVSKVYGKKKNTFRALDNVSVTIPSGTSAAIIGKSGSGKSTLMHIMSGLDRASKGAVIVDGTKLSAMKDRAIDSFRGEKIGFIFQSFFVQANESCYHNVSLPLEIARKGNRKKRIEKALAAVELSEKTHSLAKNLSGGQKQRLAIARAIVNEPSILFADEPTGNLDTVTGARVEKLLFNFNKNNGTTLVIVTHDADLAAKCDMQIHISDGKITKVAGKSAKETK